MLMIILQYDIVFIFLVYVIYLMLGCWLNLVFDLKFKFGNCEVLQFSFKVLYSVFNVIFQCWVQIVEVRFQLFMGQFNLVFINIDVFREEDIYNGM